MIKFLVDRNYILLLKTWKGGGDERLLHYHQKVMLE